MGKGSRVRASRQVRRPSSGSPGTSFGIGLESRNGAVSPPHPRSGADSGVQVPEPEERWRRADRVAAGIAQLEELVAARAALRRELAVLDDSISTGVAHLRVDGATWVQVGRALGISRQGARQRFGGDAGAHRKSFTAKHPHMSAP